MDYHTCRGLLRLPLWKRSVQRGRLEHEQGRKHLRGLHAACLLGAHVALDVLFCCFRCESRSINLILVLLHACVRLPEAALPVMYGLAAVGLMPLALKHDSSMERSVFAILGHESLLNWPYERPRRGEKDVFPLPMLAFEGV